MYNFLCLFFAIIIFSSQPALSGERLAGPYPAQVIEVIDGDTFRARIKVWLGQEIETLVRIEGMDTPELRGACVHEKELALQAKNKLQDLLGQGDVFLYDVSNGKYAGRVLARVAVAHSEGDTPQDIAGVMTAQKLARAYSGKARADWC